MHATGYYGHIRISRIIRWFVYIALVTVTSVYAQSQCFEYRWASPPNFGPWSPSTEAACASSADAYPNPEACAFDTQGNQIKYKYTYKSSEPGACTLIKKCPQGAELPRDVYVGVASNSVTCTFCSGLAGLSVPGEVTAIVDKVLIGKPASACLGTCQVSGIASACGGKPGDANWECWLTSPKFTGSQCSSTQQASTPSTTSTTADNTPKDGMCTGTINGVEIKHKCAASSSATTSTATTSGTATTVRPDGTTTTTTVTGGTTTTTITKCEGDKCTVTVTNTSSGSGFGTGTDTTSGQGTSSTSSEQTTDKNTLCQSNPNLSICKATSFSGSCSSNFACEGDAATCAIARATNDLKCATDLPAAGLVVISKLDDGTFQGGLGSVTKSISQFETNGVLPTGSPGNQTFSVGGKQFVIPLADVFNILQMMGSVLVMFTTISCSLFVAKGFN